MHAALPASYYDLGAQGWDRIAALVVSLVLSFFVAMDSFSRSFAARDAAAARNGALLAILVILPIALAVAWLGLAAAVLYPDRAVSAGILTTFVLEAFPVGLKGLMVIGILSAVMSVASICVLTASANYTRDIHQRYFQPDITHSAMLRLGTLASLGAGLLAMLMAWKMRDIIDILQLGFTINSAALFLPTIAAIYWDRVPASAAFWSSSTSLATVIGWRIAADAGMGGLFSIDPLWPGLLVSATVLVALTVSRPRRIAKAAA